MQQAGRQSPYAILAAQKNGHAVAGIATSSRGVRSIVYGVGSKLCVTDVATAAQIVDEDGENFLYFGLVRSQRVGRRIDDTDDGRDSVLQSLQ